MQAEIKLDPEFDLEEFMNFAQETRISNPLLEKLLTNWENWLPALHARQVKIGQESILALWLGHETEAAVDATWNESPSDGYMLNALAEYLCMKAVSSVLPQIADSGCAPAPKNKPEIDRVLATIPDLCNESAGKIQRRYAVITYYPFRGGCEICDLQQSCPKLRSHEAPGLTLPGYERA